LLLLLLPPGYDKYGYNKGGLYKFEGGQAATSGKN
jgi:hypothetical protein